MPSALWVFEQHCHGLTLYLSRLMTKANKMTVRPAKTQISLAFRPVWSVFDARMKKAWVLATHWAHGEDNSLIGCPGWSESSLGAQ